MTRKLIAQRLGGEEFGRDTTIYKFEMIKRAKAAAVAAHPDIPIIDMGVGEPDWRADDGVVATLAEAAADPANRWYADNGIPEFQEAAANWMATTFGVAGLDPRRQIIHGIGSKPILAMLPYCFVDPGDVVLQTVPGYPVMATHATYLGGAVHQLPLTPENGFLPDLDAIPGEVLEKAKLLYLNYPNNPTGACCDAAFFDKAVAFAHEHDVLVVSDAAYAALVYDGRKPLSILSVDGAMDVAVELHSLSKSFNMTGWRLAFITGNELAVQAYGTVKDNSDSGQFRAIQRAGIHALEHPEITAATCAKYSRRFDLLVGALSEVGFAVEKPGGSFFCYVPCPRGAGDVTFGSAAEFSKFLIEEAQISTVPWDDAGAFVRFSVTFEAADETAERKVIEEIKARLAKINLKF